MYSGDILKVQKKRENMSTVLSGDSEFLGKWLKIIKLVGVFCFSLHPYSPKKAVKTHMLFKLVGLSFHRGKQKYSLGVVNDVMYAQVERVTDFA